MARRQRGRGGGEEPSVARPLRPAVDGAATGGAACRPGRVLEFFLLRFPRLPAGVWEERFAAAGCGARRGRSARPPPTGRCSRFTTGVRSSASRRSVSIPGRLARPAPLVVGKPPPARDPALLPALPPPPLGRGRRGGPRPAPPSRPAHLRTGGAVGEEARAGTMRACSRSPEACWRRILWRSAGCSAGAAAARRPRPPRRAQPDRALAPGGGRRAAGQRPSRVRAGRPGRARPPPGAARHPPQAPDPGPAGRGRPGCSATLYGRVGGATPRTSTVGCGSTPTASPATPPLRRPRAGRRVELRRRRCGVARPSRLTPWAGGGATQKLSLLRVDQRLVSGAS